MSDQRECRRATGIHAPTINQPLIQAAIEILVEKSLLNTVGSIINKVRMAKR